MCEEEPFREYLPLILEIFKQFCDNLSRGPQISQLQRTDPNPSPWEELPPHPPVGY